MVDIPLTARQPAVPRRPVGLTDHQLRLVMRAAQSVPIAERDVFVRMVAANLGERPSNAALMCAVNIVMDRRVNRL
jgi:hypothetical protein